ncbi:MAG: hypothetical protein IKJ73_05935 [Lachnospiraceae bacterium]|nr:hypothetical protein [Lachnospiraceae bacterium]
MEGDRMNTLILVLEQMDFNDLDIDDLLDNRGLAVFDTEWIRVYNVVESLKNEGNYSEEENKNNTKLREQVFQMIYEFTNDSDLAGYVSDDFGLISDARLLGYNDLWLDKMVACYEKGSIPCGSL